jgi:hypothetical protein
MTTDLTERPREPLCSDAVGLGPRGPEVFIQVWTADITAELAD